ncbi:hypothetical protein [Gynuella sp.]|uniref:hypothetical protein n=1 Tax=Gynuella sp. TaxID=2969146 RepID=UPI003D0C5838
MNRLLTIATVLCISACTSLPDTEIRAPGPAFEKHYISTDSKIWVSSEYKRLKVASEQVHVFVEEFRPWVPDYYVIVNEAPDKNKLSLLNSRNDGWSFHDATREVLGGITFSVRSGSYDLLQSDDGGYLNLIDGTRYNAPRCGYVKHYEAIHTIPLTVDFIDMVSCGNLQSEISMYRDQNKMDKQLREIMKNYINGFPKRIETVNRKVATAFGIDG